MGGGDLKGRGGGKEGEGVEEANVFRELEGTSVDCHQGTGQLSVNKNFLDKFLYLFPGSCSCLFCTKGLMSTRTALSQCFAQKMFFSENVHF